MPKNKIVNLLPLYQYARFIKQLEEGEDVTVEINLQQFIKGNIGFSGLTEDRVLHVAAIFDNPQDLVLIIKNMQVLFQKKNLSEKKSLVTLRDSMNATLSNPGSKTAKRIQAKLKSQGLNPLILDLTKQHSKALTAARDCAELLSRTGTNLSIDENNLSQKFFEILNLANALGETFLSILVKKGDFHTLEQLIQDGLPLRCLQSSFARTNHLKQNVLMLTCVAGTLFDGKGSAATSTATETLKGRLQFLIKHNSPINEKDSYGATLLHYIAATGDKDAIKYVLSLLQEKKLLGQFLNCQTLSGQTPLHWAALNNNAEAIKLLLTLKADDTLVNKKGETAYAIAWTYGDEQTLAAFPTPVGFDQKKLAERMEIQSSLVSKIKTFIAPMSNGIIIPDTDFKHFIVNLKPSLKAENFPRHLPELKDTASFCSISDRVVYEQLLKEHIVKFIATRDKEKLQDEFFLKAYQNSNQYLWLAGYLPRLENFVEKIKALRQYWQLYVGLQGNIALLAKIKPIQEEIEIYDEPFTIEPSEAARLLDLMKPGYFELLDDKARKLIEELAHLNPIINLMPGATLLHLAVRKNNLNAVRIILGNRQNLNCRDMINRDPLFAAVAAQHPEIVAYLLPFYTTLEKDGHSLTALHYAAASSSPHSSQILKIILEQFSHFINDKDTYGMTPLCLAAATGNLANVTILGEYGGLDTRNNGFDTALLLAKGNNHSDCAEYLLKLGANPSLKNHHGYTFKDSENLWKQRQKDPSNLPLHGLFQGFCHITQYLQNIYPSSKFLKQIENFFDSHLIEGTTQPWLLKDYQYITVTNAEMFSKLLGGTQQQMGNYNHSELVSDLEKAKTLKETRIKIATILIQNSPEYILQQEKDKLNRLLPPTKALMPPSDTPKAASQPHSVSPAAERKENAELQARPKIFSFKGGLLEFNSLMASEKRTQTDPKYLPDNYLSIACRLVNQIKTTLTQQTEMETELGEFRQLNPQTLFLTANQQYLVAALENIFKENRRIDNKLLSASHLAKLQILREILVKSNYVIYSNFNINPAKAALYQAAFNSLANNIIALLPRLETLAANVTNPDAIRMFNLVLATILGNRDLEKTINALHAAAQQPIDKINYIQQILAWINFGQDIYLGYKSENRYATLSILQNSEAMNSLWHSSLSKAVVDFEMGLQLCSEHLEAMAIFKRSYIQDCLTGIRSFRNALAHGEELPFPQLKYCLGIIEEFSQSSDMVNLFINPRNNAKMVVVAVASAPGPASGAQPALTTAPSMVSVTAQPVAKSKIFLPSFTYGISGGIGDPLCWLLSSKGSRASATPKTEMVTVTIDKP